MQSSVNLEPFEQQIINSIENLLDDDEKNINPVAKVPRIETQTKGVKNLTQQFRFDFHDVEFNRSNQKKFDLNQIHMAEESHGMRYNDTNYVRMPSVEPNHLRVALQPTAASIDENSPIIYASTYGGTQDYVKWSTIESDEIQDPRQQPYIDPANYFKAVTHPTPLTPTSPSSPPIPFIPEVDKRQFVLQTPPPSPPSPNYTTQAITQQLINQYIYNRQLEEMKNQSVQQLLNTAALNPVVLSLLGIDYNAAMTNLGYNRWAQQHIINQEQEFTKILNYYNNVKQQKALKSPPKVFCSFCKNSGQP